MFDIKLFYDKYLYDYHKFKAISSYCILENPSKYVTDFFGDTLNSEEVESYITSVKCDLRHNYFHCIETFFELFFALKSSADKGFADKEILFHLANSKWRKNYKDIDKIASGEFSLNFLNDQIEFHNHKITVGHYLFYYGMFGQTFAKYDTQIKDSIEAIKIGIKIFAEDFSTKDEYNSYKHGMRLIPALAAFRLASPETMETVAEWDLNNSMSFFCNTDITKEIKVATVLFDSRRDFKLALLCSNMITNLVVTRRWSFYKNKFVEQGDKLRVGFFGKKEINDCNKRSVQIQDLVFTQKVTSK